jgi:outer membrane receptor protein involved in Fe transport
MPGRRARRGPARFARCRLCPLLALCPLAAARVAAQQPIPTDSAQIAGVVHTSSGVPAIGVTIELLGTTDRATTADSGTFTLGRVTPGTYTLVAHDSGWLTARTRITARGGQLVRIVLTMTPVGAAAPAKPGATALPTVNVQGQAVTQQTYGLGTSPTGANDYAVAAKDITNLPAGDNTTITDVLAQMPGVAIDQNQQIHIRNTEGPQFQYQIDGALVPLDINTNPPFISMFNPMFVSRMDLLDGILPSRYSYATGGVVDIQTKEGCTDRGGNASLFFGQRGTLEPGAQYAGCAGTASYYIAGRYDQGQTAFSSATPGPNPIHDETEQGQLFGYVSVPLSSTTTLKAILSTAASNNQLPNVADLPPEFTLAGASDVNSGAINSCLNFRDYLGMIMLSGTPTTDMSYRLTYAAHSITQHFVPDNTGELIFQGVASTASHDDVDNTLQGDLSYQTGHHSWSTGFYLGEYRVLADDRSLVFPVDSSGDQTTSSPITVVNDAHATNIVSGVYVNDLWQIAERLKLDLGLRWDDVTGFTSQNQFDPTVNLSYLLAPRTTVHAGFARYMQVPSFQGVSPTAPTAFAGTTAAGPPGVSTPLTEDDLEWDLGVTHHLSDKVTVSEDNFYEMTHHYLDTGQFGVVPIFAPFNYDGGLIWGVEGSGAYTDTKLSAYANVTIGRNLQKGVETGQFNFPADELAYIDSHYIVLDHQPLYGASAGGSYRWQRVTFSLDGVYSSGLRAGFADLEPLPTVVQINAAAEYRFHVPVIGTVSDRLTVLNVLDRINLIRPAEGIGIFQSAYGPRFTLLDAITIPF